MRTVDMVAPLVALAEAGIPTDIQELLIQGDPMRGIPPGALTKAIAAALSSMEAGVEPVAWQFDTCHEAKPGDWRNRWTTLTDREAGHFRDLATRVPDEVRVRPLYPSPASVPAGARVADEMVEQMRYGIRDVETGEPLDDGAFGHVTVEDVREAIAALAPVEAVPVAWVPKQSLDDLHKDGSHVAVRTAIHRVPLKSGNGVPLYAHPLDAPPHPSRKPERGGGSSQPD